MADNNKLLEIIERDLTPTAWKSLVSYAQYILDKDYLWRRADKVTPEGKTAEDFVQETILKIIDGDREWDQNNNPDLISALRGHIKSVISGTFRRKEHKTSTNILIPIDDEDEDKKIDSKDDSLDDLTMIELQETISKIYKLNENDEEIKDVLVCFEEGMDKRKEIADFLEISPDEVTNRIKRLHRKIEELKKSI
jgi:RNA polymerase sigma factor (sigma-70 family)